MQRAQALPFKSIGRVATNLPLTELVTPQHATNIVFVAVVAGQVELASASIKISLSGGKSRCCRAINDNVNGYPFGLMTNVGAQG